jgi:hypothetical protein
VYAARYPLAQGSAHRGQILPSIEDEPEVYQLVPAPFVARARAVEVLDYLACLSHHAVEEDLALIDECIAELRELQPTAATEIPESVTRKLKGAA